MKYYYLVVDYNGWCVFQSDTLPEDKMIDWPFITTCLDNALGMCKLFRERNFDYWLSR